ncbi:MAG: thioredoxin family protein [Acidobacteriota bacterium]|nr:thioredoxin family protein [Acidobacteriota bacterium]
MIARPADCREILMAIEWRKDVEAALAEARSAKKPLLLDFSAAPM